MRLLWLSPLLLNIVVIFGYQDVPSCAIEGITDWDWELESYRFKDNINDDHEGIIIKFPCINVIAAEVRDSKYLEVSLVGNELKFFVSAEFQMFEENESDRTITENLYIKCLPKISSTESALNLDDDELAEKEEMEDKDYHLTLSLTVNDINSFAPTFTMDEYVFNYYQDLLKSATLTEAQRISAKDKDMSTTFRSLSFAIEKNDYFAISRLEREDESNKKSTIAIVRADKYINAPFNKTFTITVVDSGKPEVKSATAKLTVQLFAEQTLVFTKPVYHAEIDGRNLKITDGPIQIVGGHDLDTIYDIKSDDGINDNFKITQTVKSITISIEWALNQTLIDDRDYLYLTVTANKVGRVGHFAVMIKGNGGQSTTTTDNPPTTAPSTGGTETNLDAFEAWILAGTVLVWISFSLLVVAFLMVIFSFKKYWQKKYNL